MSTLNPIELIHQKYNAEPVFYCKKCLSLKIMGLEGMDYCDDCGSTDVEECSIEEWENKYTSKFGHTYLEEF